ncbi:MAG: hypothetical protein LUO93_01445 [Methanomicrobiales archaeon]|nr:hypothetical protein [Methanomicrobiales archaeon]
MKTLAFHPDERKQHVTVDCADGELSVYRYCAFCAHCAGVRVGGRMVPSPQKQAMNEVRNRGGGDEALLQAAMMFNTLVRDGTAIECDDDANQGFRSLYRN